MASRKVRWKGEPKNKVRYLSRRTVQAVRARERIMGWKSYSTTIIQGSWNKGVAASAGTHDGPGVWDGSSYKVREQQRYGACLGIMVADRVEAEGFTPHTHNIMVDEPGMTQIVKRQQEQIEQGLNALASRRPWRGYKPKVWPSFIEDGYVGYVQAKDSTGEYENPTGKSRKVDAVGMGGILYVVAEVKSGRTRWYVTLDGLCVQASKFRKIKYSSKAKTGTVVARANTYQYRRPFSSSKLRTAVVRKGQKVEITREYNISGFRWYRTNKNTFVPAFRF